MTSLYICAQKKIRMVEGIRALYISERLFYILTYGSPTEEVKDKEDKKRIIPCRVVHLQNITRIWASPKVPKELFDNSYVNLCNIRQSLLIEEELEKVHYATEPFTEEEVQNSIDKLNTNKSSDEYGINAEHLKNSKKSISSFLTKTFNKILEIRKAPTSFKTGV